jgi:hypothetical protein
LHGAIMVEDRSDKLQCVDVAMLVEIIATGRLLWKWGLRRRRRCWLVVGLCHFLGARVLLENRGP